MSKTRLSKSKILTGSQCAKALYLAINEPDLAPEVSASQQLIFDQGHEVGLFAQTQFKGGTLIDAPYDKPDLAIKQTQDAIKAGALHIYEATLLHQDVLVKVDILTRENPKAPWNIIEVKSSTQVKEVHLLDVAVQCWVCQGAGLEIDQAFVYTINNQCTFEDLSQLFNKTQVTQLTQEFLKSLPKTIKQLKVMLESDKEPKDSIGPHCDDPYECAFKTHCYAIAKVPQISVHNVPRLSSIKKWKYFEQGLIELKDLPIEDFNKQQQRMIEQSIAQERYINKEGIKKAIKDWEYPLLFLDFESIAFAIPRYAQQKPYQQLPFQFSCHIKESPGAELIHVEYLHTQNTDPRANLADALIKLLPKNGTILAYNKAFESMVLKSLAEACPKYRKELTQMAARLADPLPVIRDNVYDPAFMGSFSIKAVAPALLGQNASYEGMQVGDGGSAQAAYLELISDKTNSKRRTVLKNALSAYCTKDTLSMVQLVEWLQKLTS